jgi:NADPH:quinone reductase-like Zn-dependent oxidoreductase
MKAVLLHEHGGPEVLAYADSDAPRPGPGEVQIEVRAIAMNRADLWVREGWPGIKLEYPHILGADAAGVIGELGEGAAEAGLQVGQRVAVNPTMSDGTCEFCRAGQDNLCPNFGILGEHLPGTYREMLVVPARNLLALPDHVPFETAAAASLVYLTAWHSLVEKGRVQAGETVLVVGAGGGVNVASIQIAKLKGATVYVVGSSDEKLARAEEMGADALINRHEEDWSKAIFSLTGRRGVDVVVDNVGQATWFNSIRALRKGGRMLVVGNTSGPKVEVDIRYVFGKHVSILGSTMGTHETFRTVMPLVFDGTLTPVIDRTFPLQDARAAHEYFDGGALFGKVVLVP